MMRLHGKSRGTIALTGTSRTVDPLEPRRLLAFAIDAGFAGGAGATITQFQRLPAQLHALAPAPSDKLWAGGLLQVGDDERAVLFRINGDGTLDTSYRGTGALKIDAAGPVRQIAPLQSGAFLLAGNDFVAKITSGGALDTSFGGGDGIVFFNLVTSIALDRSGAFYVASGSIVRKYNASGSLDTGWANTGARNLKLGATGGFYEAIEPTIKLKTGPYNRLVIGIDATDESGMGSAGVIRLNAYGALDNGFSGDGIALIPTIGSQSLRDVVVLSDTQTIVLLNGEDNANGVYAFTGKGTPKSILGLPADESSIAPVELRGGNAFADEALSIIEQPGGKPLIVGGFADSEDGVSYGAAMRLNGDFTLDNAFALDADGVAAGTGVRDADAFATSVAATSDSVYLLQSTSAGGRIVRLRETDATVPVIRDGGKVLVKGSDAPEDIVITADSRLRVGIGGERYATRLATQLQIEANGGDDDILIDDTISPRDGLYVRAGDGNDRVISYAQTTQDQVHRFYGGNGRDDIRVATARSVIFGEADKDTLYGSTSDDALFGGDGNDLLVGGAGNDYLEGNGGNDILDGSAGDDRLLGQSGHDVLIGGKGNDSLYGFSGLDTLKGSAGSDYLDAGPDDDVLDALDATRDTLFGGSGADRATTDPALDLIDGIETIA